MKGLWNSDKEVLNDSGSMLTGDGAVLKGDE